MQIMCHQLSRKWYIFRLLILKTYSYFKIVKFMSWKTSQSTGHMLKIDIPVGGMPVRRWIRSWQSQIEETCSYYLQSLHFILQSSLSGSEGIPTPSPNSTSRVSFSIGGSDSSSFNGPIQNGPAIPPSANQTPPDNLGENGLRIKAVTCLFCL